MNKIGILLIGHGSRMPSHEQLIQATAEMMKEQRPESRIHVAFLTGSHPTVSEGIELMRDEEIDVLVVLPLFLGKGVHVVSDIPACIGLNSGEKIGEFSLSGGIRIPMVYADPIGADILLASLMLKNADAALSLIGDLEK